MGRSTHVEEPNIISEFSYSQLKRFKEKHYVPERIVLAGVGMEHEKLVEMVNKTFGQQKPSGKVKVNENASTTSPYYLDTSFSTYRGGALYVEDQRKEAEDAAFLYPPYFKFDASVVVAFEAPGLFSGPDFYSACLLQWLMGSGGSFTSGGPGKGMYSRTYQDVLCYSYVETASTFHWPYSDTGLFGLWLTGRQERVFHLLELSINTLHNMAKIDEDEFIRARNQVKSSLFSNLETRGVILEDLQKQSLLYNLYTESSEHVAMLDQLTVESVQEFAVRMLTRHPPTVLIYSDPKFYNADQVAGTDAHIHQFLRSKFNS